MDDVKINIDYLENGFSNIKIKLNDKPNEINEEATLIFKESTIKTTKAVLYVHGFVDYFFQTELGDFYVQNGFNFYAIDLRKYGRSLKPHHKQNYTSNINEYFEELDKSIEIIKNRNNSKIILMGHSAGGLITSIYANKNKNIDGLILNSPFFEFNENKIKRLTLFPLISVFGKIFPYTKIKGLSKHYAASLHKDYNGEWDFKTDWKPIHVFPIYLGWIKAVRKAQKELHKGLNIKCPVLVLFSNRSLKDVESSKKLKFSDGVLNVNHIKKYANKLGENVTKIEIENGIHDLILSKKEVRDKVYESIKKWISNNNL